MLIGAYIVCNYARVSLTSSGDASASKRIPSNWAIDSLQEKLVQEWAEAKQIWFPSAEEDIDLMVGNIGFINNYNGQGVNYISERLHLEDMHPANVFVDSISSKPVCIDCIVKFRRN